MTLHDELLCHQRILPTLVHDGKLVERWFFLRRYKQPRFAKPSFKTQITLVNHSTGNFVLHLCDNSDPYYHDNEVFRQFIFFYYMKPILFMTSIVTLFF